MKKIFTLILFSMITFNAIHAKITWNLSNDGTLTISGSDMPDYEFNGTPWYNVRDKIKKVVIENGVTNIGRYAFYNCSILTSITIPNSVTSIGYHAFAFCPGLTSIDIPNSVTNIGDYAFSGCTGLTSVTIPNSVTSIGNFVFANTFNLTSIIVEKENKRFDSRNDCNAIITTNSNVLIVGCKNTIIPNSVTSIGKSAFCNCSSLTSITIPNSVTSIGDYAFSGCSALTSITIPSSVTSIGQYAFEKCSGLTSLIIGMTKIPSDIFSSSSSLTSVTILDGVTSIGSRAFSGCSYLTSITIPNSVTSIGTDAFLGTKWIEKQSDGIVYAGLILYKYKGTMPANTNVVIKEGTTIIENSAFGGCSGLTSVTIPESVTSIGSWAFYGCTGLTSVTIPKSVTSIGSSAFNGCSGLTSVTLPESMTNIGSEAFNGAKLRNIVIKAKTPPSGGSAFSGQSYYHTTLMVPEGSWDAYAYSNNWYQFINIREMVDNAVNLTNSKAYTMKLATEGSYLFYDSVNDCVATLNETALDDTEENTTWMTVEVDGKHYVYNLGAKKFLVADKTNAKTGYRLSDVPASINIEDGKDAIVFGKSKEFYMVINDKLNVDEGLESQIIATTGIKGVSVEANQPTVTYNVNGQIVPDNTKGLHIRNGKKVVVK